MSSDLRPGRLRQALGGYREHEVPLALAGVAEGVWTHTTPADGPRSERGMHRVLPDPSLNVVFRCFRTADGRADAAQLTIIGPKTRPFLFRFQPGHEIAAVRLKLEWARYLIGLDPADHRDAEHDLLLVQPCLAGSLMELLGHSRSAWEAVGTLSATLAQRAGTLAGAGDRRGPRAAAPALDLVRASTGRLRVDLIAQRLGVSPRQLRRAVRTESALSLKAHARMARLNAAMAASDSAVRPAWSRIAHEAGFCDQSHLVRECRALAGLAPGDLHRERRAQADLSNLRRA